jgi:UDPglucose 6-dehydrogenase
LSVNITVIGTGYVGLVTGTCLAETGNDVICVDCDQRKVDMLGRGEVPIYEPGLEELVKRNFAAGRLTFTTSLAESVRGAAIVFLAVGTPPSADGSVDLAALWSSVEELAPHLPGDAVVVLKSTVPVGTNAAVAARLSNSRAAAAMWPATPSFSRKGRRSTTS